LFELELQKIRLAGRDPLERRKSISSGKPPETAMSLLGFQNAPEG